MILALGRAVIVIHDIALSLAPEVTGLRVMTWVRVGVNRAQSLYDMKQFPVVSVCFHRVLDDVLSYSASFS